MSTQNVFSSRQQQKSPGQLENEAFVGAKGVTSRFLVLRLGVGGKKQSQTCIHAHTPKVTEKEQYIWKEKKVKVAQSCLTLWPHGLWPARLLCPWSSSGKNTGVGSHSLLQEIFPTEGSNPGLLHCWLILYLERFTKSLKHSPSENLFIIPVSDIYCR